MARPRARPVIMVINPCHATPPEHAFWEGVAETARERGWTLVQIATRLLPATEGACSVSLPARLSDLDHRLRAVALSRPPWLPPGHVTVLEDWEHRRWQLDRRLPAVVSGVLRLAAYIDSVLDELRPAIVLTLNKIDHPVYLFRRAALARGVPTAVVERSPLDGIWLEPNGLFRESEIWTRYPGGEEAESAAGLVELAALRGNPGSFRKVGGGVRRTRRLVRKLRRPRVLLPMDNVLWTGWEQSFHPMASIDNPLFEDPFVAMSCLDQHVRDLGGTLVVKRHPACLAVNEATVPVGARFVEGDLDTLLHDADVVVAFNTKVAFPALALGKPVVTLAPNPVARSGATYHARDTSEVVGALSAAARKDALTDKLSLFPPFLAWLKRGYFYDCEERDAPGDGAERRGPARFCRDVVERAAAPTEALTAEARTKLGQILYAGAPPRPASGRRPRAGSGPTAAGRRHRSSPVAKAVSTLRRDGVGELGRKVLVRSLSWTDRPFVASLVTGLERFGLDLREVKAKNPYLVTYRTAWGGLRAEEVPVFEEVWQQGLPRSSAVHPTGCSPAARERLRRLRGRHDGEELGVVLGGEGRRAARPTRLLVLDRLECAAQGSADFFCTLDWDTAGRLAGARTPMRSALWLPQRFYGLVPPGMDVLWFGCGAPAPSLGDDLSVQGVVRGGGVLAALHVAVHLGIRSVSIAGPAGEATRERILELTQREGVAVSWEEV